MVAGRRILGWAIAGALLAGVSTWAAYFAPDHRPAAVNLDFTLKDLNGHDVRLADFKGRPMLVNFWATWCGPCLLETPELVELADQYRDRGLVIVGISTDDTAEQIRPFASTFKVTYPLLVGKDREDVFTAFGLGSGIPMTVFIRPDGSIAERLQGINTKRFFQQQIDGLF
jgi:thiol-disulfide isomerase/thioredoxin